MWVTRRVYGSTGTPSTDTAVCSRPTVYARSANDRRHSGDDPWHRGGQPFHQRTTLRRAAADVVRADNRYVSVGVERGDHRGVYVLAARRRDRKAGHGVTGAVGAMAPAQRSRRAAGLTAAGAAIDSGRASVEPGRLTRCDRGSRRDGSKRKDLETATPATQRSEGSPRDQSERRPVERAAPTGVGKASARSTAPDRGSLGEPARVNRDRRDRGGGREGSSTSWRPHRPGRGRASRRRAAGVPRVPREPWWRGPRG